MSHPVAKFYDVVRLKLIKPGYAQNITISCLVVDKTPAVCNMVGICQLAKKLQKRGADIADVRLLNQKRDVLTNDILLGADYFMSVNRVNVPPTRILSTYLLNTIFGQCIIGKIPGSTKLANSDAINTLSVVHVATGNIGGRDELHHPKLLSCDETLDSFNVDEVVSEFSSFSDIGINLDDREKLNFDALTHFKDTVKYHEDSKQFECGIPWVNSNPPEDLPHNQFIIFRMFLSTILLIATVTSLLLHGKEELSAEHLFKAETLWFGELQSIYFSEELAFLSNIQNHATKDSFTKRIVR